ncbi:MAG: hypothetical protein HY349_04310 [Nitrospirae bacterium]|nr:hypothetical protein [Nitrospirota bacterium]
MNGTTLPILRERSLFRRSCVTAAIFLVVFTIGNQALLQEEAALHWWTDSWWTLTSLTAGLLCLDAARQPMMSNQKSWLFISLGCFFWALGMVAWDVYELVFQWITPFPSLADAGYSIAFLLLLTGCLFTTHRRHSLFERSKLVLDCMILINVLAIGLTVFFYEAIVHAPMSVAGKVIALFYPIVPLSASYALWMSRSRMEADAGRQSLGWVMAGMILLASANIGYLAPIITGGYQVGSRLDPLWTAAFLCIGLGALNARLKHTVG